MKMKPSQISILPSEERKRAQARKPEISYNRDTGQFLDHGQWITDDHMWSLWNEVGSADWTQGAFNKVIDLLQKGANRNDA